MEVIINGKQQQLSKGCTVAQLLDLLGLEPTLLAVERNKNIVPKSKYEEEVLAEKDSIEIVTFVGGGA